MAQKLCPICEKAPVDATHAPFCSKRCADVDLNRWFTGRYAIPAAEADESSEDPVPDLDSEA
ncbi:MAG TPA: DNA gyrase inhibitor YacG [Caulobacteraceae bacterium]|jgi:hypothetical protein|nr:DNA gyrase inhibitor YacG [Caulobacteraceae bacterium]